MAKDDIGRLGIAQEILRKSTDLLRRIIAPVDGTGGVTLSCVCPQCKSFSLDEYIWCVSTGHGDSNNKERSSIATGGVRLVEANTNGEHPTGYWWCSSLPMPMKRRSSKRTQRLWGCVPDSKHCNRPARKKQKRHHGRAEKLYPNG